MPESSTFPTFSALFLNKISQKIQNLKRMMVSFFSTALTPYQIEDDKGA
ncbi:hypothetical protein HMPREF9390_0899 [Streptococcus sanguinis SK405]|uniref:Uncharacterized protein n=1 Tax=Streptococcus sanguinis SK405 TaxID=888817 RepID=A0ABC9PE45_STRSA|nr:hypothetical protein HMPREF9390_0899 [Streptococcus sanguinis SK405]